MNYRMVSKDAFRVVGIHRRIRLIYEGINPEIAAMFQGLDEATIARLKELSQRIVVSNLVRPVGPVDVNR